MVSCFKIRFTAFLFSCIFAKKNNLFLNYLLVLRAYNYIELTRWYMYNIQYTVSAKHINSIFSQILLVVESKEVRKISRWHIHKVILIWDLHWVCYFIRTNIDENSFRHITNKFIKEPNVNRIDCTERLLILAQFPIHLNMVRLRKNLIQRFCVPF